MAYDESKHQEAFFKWLELQHPKLFELCFHIPNEGKRSYALANVMRRKGLKAGIPDVFCAIPSGDFHGLFIEFKKERENLSPIQKERKLLLSVSGYRCVVCYSFEDAKKSFIEYINIGSYDKKMGKCLQEK